MEPEPHWVDNLRRYASLRELRRSDFFAACGPRILSYLETPEITESAGSAPHLKAFVRIAQWNIEKGRRLDAVLERLASDEVLRWTDVLILNEADRGMARTGNRHVARDLADALGMHLVFGPAHFELTRRVEEELVAAGVNGASLQGNAILSRHPVLEARLLPLPATFEPFESAEKRFGNRSCLWARLGVPGGSLWVGAVHLELRNTPRCRARQMRHLLGNLPGKPGDACVLGGDLNTNGFARGTAWRTLGSVCRLLVRPADTVRHELLAPEFGREPLFEVAARHGFAWGPFNSRQETARAPLDALEESALLPGFVRQAVLRRVAPNDGCLCFKLDWLLGKGVRALRPGTRRDGRTGIASLGPGVREFPSEGPGRISDHRPIHADIDLFKGEDRGE